jgi:hypothetical protein
MRTVVITCALAVAGCARPHTGAIASVRDLAFVPTSITASPAGPFKAKGPFPIQLAVTATRTIAAADAITLRVSAGGVAVASVPVVVDVPKTYDGGGTTKQFTATVEVPAGDYEVELVRADRPILGHAFKLASVPVWGGGKQVHFFAHQNTRVDLDNDVLRLARWVVEDSPTQGWVVEWWHAGQRVTTTKGRTDPWPSYQLDALVDAATHKDGARASIWSFGSERYAIPKDLIHMGGQWEARIYREGAPPVALAFELPIALETQESRVAAIGLSLSSPLFLRPLPEGLGADVFAAIPGKQEPALAPTVDHTAVDPIAFDQDATRALFRSPELARKWRSFLELEARAPERAKKLRPEIVGLIQKHGGPWLSTDAPE